LKAQTVMNVCKMRRAVHRNTGIGTTGSWFTAVSILQLRRFTGAPMTVISTQGAPKKGTCGAKLEAGPFPALSFFVRPQHKKEGRISEGRRQKAVNSRN